MPNLGIDLLHHIKGHRMLRVSGVKINNIIDTRLRNKLDYFFRQIAVRIHQSHSATGANIFHNHILLQSGFSHSGFTNNICMPAPVIGLNPEPVSAIAESGFTNRNYIIVILISHKNI